MGSEAGVSKRAMAATAIERTGLGRLLRRTKSWRGLLVLNYHRLAHSKAEVYDRGVWSSTPEHFAEQVAFLQRQGDLIDPADLTADLISPAARSRTIVLTFDDGYRDNYELALPILRDLGAKAAFFIITGPIDSPRPLWWDEIAWLVRGAAGRDLTYAGHHWKLTDDGHREHAIEHLLRQYKKLPTLETEPFLDGLARAAGGGRMPAELGRELWLTWDEVREMAAAGMTIGGHTVSHPLLSRSDPHRIEAEIRDCERRLREEVGRPMHWFSYPVGGQSAFNATVKRVLQETGVRWACSQYGGFQRPGDLDPLNVRRVPVERWMAGPQFCTLVAVPGLFA